MLREIGFLTFFFDEFAQRFVALRAQRPWHSALS
jgi:hypothetical protein